MERSAHFYPRPGGGPHRLPGYGRTVSRRTTRGRSGGGCYRFGGTRRQDRGARGRHPFSGTFLQHGAQFWRRRLRGLHHMVRYAAPLYRGRDCSAAGGNHCGPGSLGSEVSAGAAAASGNTTGSQRVSLPVASCYNSTITPQAINFMAKYGRGLVCLAMTEERLDHLRIGPMTAENTSNYGTAFCEAIDAREGVTTGISAYDRARTIQVAVDPSTRPSDLARPGHVFPLRARKGGVLVRAGQTEASVDLARLAGLIPAGIICEIMKDDGTMARVPDLIEF